MTTIALPAAEPAVVAPPPTPRTPVDPVDLDPVRAIGMPVVPDGVLVELLDTGPTEEELAAEAAAAEAAAEAAAREAEAAAAALAAAVAEGVERELAERAAAEAAAAAQPAGEPATGADTPAADPATGAVTTAADPATGADTAAVGAADAPATAGTQTNGSAPLPAGTTHLARYLRDNNFVFTGSVMGPVSVGVFRSQLEAKPVVVALGQTLPDTDIVLTDLRGMQAELTLDDSTQILSLDLRR